jgi:hypothetical protein
VLSWAWNVIVAIAGFILTILLLPLRQPGFA